MLAVIFDITWRLVAGNYITGICSCSGIAQLLCCHTPGLDIFGAFGRTAVVLTYDGTAVESISCQGIVFPLRVLLVN